MDWLLAVAFPQWDTVIKSKKAFRPAALAGLFIFPKLQDGLAPCSRLSPMGYRYQKKKGFRPAALTGLFFPEALRWIGSLQSPFPECSLLRSPNPKKPFGLRP